MKIAAYQFKAKCLKLMDDVYKYHEEIIITKYGKPIAKLVPVEEEGKFKKPIFGLLEGMITIFGDIIGAIEEKWNADE
jgi:prevent-host-death family protein